MRENVGNLMTSEIELRQQLSALECDWLTSYLHAKNGVADVKWGGKSRRLFVEYDTDIFGSAELVGVLNICGIRVVAVRVGYPVDYRQNVDRLRRPRTGFAPGPGIYQEGIEIWR